MMRIEHRGEVKVLLCGLELHDLKRILELMILRQILAQASRQFPQIGPHAIAR